jgi:S1-C subfamily serine protease
LNGKSIVGLMMLRRSTRSGGRRGAREDRCADLRIGLGLAVPIDDTTLRIVSALMREGRYRRAYLGVAGGPQPLPPRIAKQLGRPTAVQVLQVVDGSPAALAGVQAGDRILDVDGTTVTGVADLQRPMNEDAIGRAVPVRSSARGSHRT